MKENIYGEPTPESQGYSQGTPEQDSQPTQQQSAQPTQQVPYAQQAGQTYGQQAGAQQTSSQSYGQQPFGQTQPTQQQPRVQTPPIPGAYQQAQQSANQGYAQQPYTGTGAQHAAQPQTQVQPAPEPKQKKQRPGLKAVLAGLLGGVIGAGALTAVLLATGVVGTKTVTTSSGSTSTTQSVTIDPSDEDTTVANAVAAKVLPSVVSVYVTSDDGTAMGSGVIYDSDGNIITNNHVIEDATAISVTIDGKPYDAELVGTDASSDIAVIKADLNGDTVTPIEIGSSSDLQVGDWVMTVGSPFGLENSVSQGIVSALYRNTLMEGSSGNTLYTNLIQTDANINPGNSGGALVDSEGKLVGISTLYSSSTESSAGVGFAIPSDYATEIADKIIAGETVTHAYIGLSMATVNSQNAASNNLSVNYGAYVAEVTEGAPADEAGIEVGDVIIAIGDTEITSADGAILAIRSHSIGETVTVTVMRGNDEKTFEVTLGSDEALQQTTTEDDSTTTDDTTSDGYTLEQLQELYNEMMQQYQQQQQQQDPFGNRQR